MPPLPITTFPGQESQLDRTAMVVGALKSLLAEKVTATEDLSGPLHNLSGSQTILADGSQEMRIVLLAHENRAN
jgi:hypothetical protein